MRIIPRLLGVGLLGLLAGLLLLTSCEATRTRESTDPTREAQRLTDEAAARAARSRQIAQVNEAGPPTFKMGQAVLAAAFIRQFGDGTWLIRCWCAPRPAPPKKRPRTIWWAWACATATSGPWPCPCATPAMVPCC